VCDLYPTTLCPRKEAKRDLAYTAAERRVLRAPEIGKAGVPQAKRPRYSTGGAVPNRYPIALHLRYKAKGFPVEGFGQTVMISNQDIVFAPDNGLKPGMGVEIALAWPFRLDNRIQLQLVLQVAITGSGDGVAEARILAYDFRTAGPAEALGC
jgi:hypothetical protein